MRTFKARVMLFSCSLLFIGHVFALDVIVHPSNSNDVTEKEIVRIFLGKQSQFANGAKVKAYSLDDKHTLTAEFVTKMLKKNPSQFKAYWAKLIFTGQGQPPKYVNSEDEIMEQVSKDPNAIGFVSESSSDKVKVVFSL